jgi:hypothetical protein
MPGLPIPRPLELSFIVEKGYFNARSSVNWVENTASLYRKYSLPPILSAERFEENRVGSFLPARTDFFLRKGGRNGGN